MSPALHKVAIPAGIVDRPRASRADALPAVTLVIYRKPRELDSCVMFLEDQRLCPVSLGVARTRLADAAAGGWLSQASAAAFRDGLDHLLWPGPPEDPSGLSQLTRTHFLDPAHQEDSTSMGMRWEATGQLFAALDADITLAAEGDQHTRMTLTGVYRPPLDPLNAGLDRALSHQVATATIGSLLTRICGALQATGPAPGDAPTPGETGPETTT